MNFFILEVHNIKGDNMFKTRSLINKWHLLGFFWILIVGSLLHFTYKWSGKSEIVGFFSPVNESVWEHLKLGYFSLLFFTFIEYWFLRFKTSSYFFSKFLGIISMIAFILICHYGYELITKKSSTVVDIGCFIIGAMLCQIVSKNVMKTRIKIKTEIMGLVLFIAFGIVFFIFTYNPLNLPIFIPQ